MKRTTSIESARCSPSLLAGPAGRHSAPRCRPGGRDAGHVGPRRRQAALVNEVEISPDGTLQAYTLVVPRDAGRGRGRRGLGRAVGGRRRRRAAAVHRRRGERRRHRLDGRRLGDHLPRQAWRRRARGALLDPGGWRRGAPAAGPRRRHRPSTPSPPTASGWPFWPSGPRTRRQEGARGEGLQADRLRGGVAAGRAVDDRGRRRRLRRAARLELDGLGQRAVAGRPAGDTTRRGAGAHLADRR